MLLVDREAETLTLRTAIRRAQRGEGSVTVVRGALGIGRSALLRAAAEQAGDAGVAVLRASASRLEQAFPYGVAGQILEPSIMTSSEAVGATGGARQPFAVSEDRSPEPTRAVLAALSGLLAAATGGEPAVVLVDDLQWADGPSLRWLSFMGRRIAATPAALVLAVHDGLPAVTESAFHDILSVATVVRLRPLSPGGTARMIAEHLGQHPELPFLQACRDRFEGNPLMLTTGLQAMSAAGVRPIAASAERTGLPVPALVDRLTLALADQPEHVRALASAIAVAGPAVPSSLAGSIAGLDATAVDDAVHRLDELGLTRHRHGPRLRHPAVAEAALATMVPAERGMLHERTATVLYEHGFPAEDVARHVAFAVGADKPWVIEVLRAAAGEAAERGALSDALGHLRLALMRCGTGDASRRARLLLNLALVRREIDPAAAVHHLIRAAPDLADPVERAAAAAALICPTMMRMTSRAAVELLQQTAAELGPPGPAGSVRRDLALRLEARLRLAGLGDATGLAAAVEQLQALGTRPAMTTVGERELLAALLHAATLSAALPAAQVAGLATGLLRYEPPLSGVAYSTAQVNILALNATDSAAVGVEWLRTALAAAEARHSPVERVLLGSSYAHALMSTGRLREAAAAAVTTRELAGTDLAEVAACAIITQVMVAIERREFDHAAAALAQAAPLGGAASWRTMLRLLEACIMAGRHDPRAAEHLLDAGRELDRLGRSNPVLFPWRIRTASVLLRDGRRSAAVELIEQESERAAAWGAPVGIARVLRARAALADRPATAESLLRAAIHVLGGSPNQLERARVHLQLGELLRAADPAESRRMLRAGQRLALECGLPMSDSSGNGLAAMVSSAAAALTPSELRVATAAAAGRTNQQIATLLAIGIRAVEKHLTRCYQKLGVPGRAELRTALDAAAGPNPGYAVPQH